MRSYSGTSNEKNKHGNKTNTSLTKMLIDKIRLFFDEEVCIELVPYVVGFPIIKININVKKK